MLIEVAIIGAVYAGCRVYENYISKNKKEPEVEQVEDTSESTVESELNQIATSVSDFELYARPYSKKDNRYNMKIGALTMGSAILRNTIPIFPFAALNLGLYLYCAFPLYRLAEKSFTEGLIKNKKVDFSILATSIEVLLLSTSRYTTASIGLLLRYFEEEILFTVKEKSERTLNENLSKNLYNPDQKVWLVVQDHMATEVPLKEIRQGDVIAVKAGEPIPVDGEVVDGMATVDQQAFTGESYPVEKGIGENVFASTLALTGKLHIRVEKSGNDTSIAKIGNILLQSFMDKTDAQLNSEKMAESANAPFLGAGAIGLVTLGPTGAMNIMASNALLGLRTLGPLSTLNHLSLASYNNILIKGGLPLEKATTIDTILFDKTGTLTDGALNVCGIAAIHSSYTNMDILFYAAVAEHQMNHPIAQAIQKKAQETNIHIPDITDAVYKLGFGISVTVDNKTIHVGSARFMDVEGIGISEEMEILQKKIHSYGRSSLLVAIDHGLAGVIELEASIRPEIPKVISELRKRNIKHIGIVSGDHADPTKQLANLLGVDSFFYEVLPEDKSNIVKEFQEQGKKVCFVGDGVNDTIAMQQADLSISMSGSTTLATDVAQVILLDPDLNGIMKLMDFANGLDQNLKRSFSICKISMGSVLGATILFHINFLTAIGIIWSFGMVNLGNTALPLLEIERDKKTKHGQD